MSAIQTRGLTKYYGAVRGIEDLSVAVKRGEVFGFLGPNGAGKTTTIRTLLGFLHPTAGEATVLGHDIREESALVEAKRRVGYLPADPSFAQDVTGEQLLRYHGRLKGAPRQEELVSVFEPPVDRAVDEYSRGNHPQLAAVLAFMHDPDLVLVDEPTAGLDPLMQERFYEFIERERDRGLTVFLSSHVLPEVRRVCDRIGVVRDGQFVTVESVSAPSSGCSSLIR